MKSFDDFGFSEEIRAAIATLGYTEPTPVQQRGIPVVLAGNDLIAAAKTGTGKTAAFALPAMNNLERGRQGQGPFMLVVTPTRELAQQIGSVCETIAASTRHRVTTVVGGVSYKPQISQLRHGTDILIATPGRLIDLMDQTAVALDHINVLVLDEADRMLDMGFLPAVRRIVAACPTKRQTLLFSATIDRSIEKNMKSLLRNPVAIEVARKGETADTIDQYVIHASAALKPTLLNAVLERKGSKRVIVFARTRSRADSVCRRLKRAGYHAEAIHSNRTQNQRKRALERFTLGETSIIVATDVLARGIDVEDVSYVVNYDLPSQPEDYIHRIGRTGRAGAHGFAVSFVTPDTVETIRAIKKLTKGTIPPMELEGFDLEEAENNAVEKANQAKALRDPEIIKARQGLAKKARKKEAARDHDRPTPHKSTSRTAAAPRQKQAARPAKGLRNNARPVKRGHRTPGKS